MPTNDSLMYMLDKPVEAKPVKEIIEMSPAVLEGITDAKAAKLKEALGVSTIAELATNRFVLWAQALVTIAKVEREPAPAGKTVDV